MNTGIHHMIDNVQNHVEKKCTTQIHPYASPLLDSNYAIRMGWVECIYMI